MSNIRFIPFQASHLLYLQLQPVQRDVQRLLTQPGYGEQLEAPDLSWSGEIDGKIVGCGGIFPQWPGRGLAWSLIGDAPTRAWIAISWQAKRVIARAHELGYRRLDATVLAGHAEGCRWMDALGFKIEGKMHCYDLRGNDHYLYARIRRDAAPQEVAA